MTRGSALLVAVLGGGIVACGAAPQDSTQETDEALCRIDVPCQPPRPPPIPRGHWVSSWSALSRFGVNGTMGNYTCPNTTFAMLAQKYEQISEYPVWSARTDTIGKAALALMNPNTYNCSQPVKWSTEDPDPSMQHPQPCPPTTARIDLAWFHAVMCPIGGANAYQNASAIQSYLNSHVGQVTESTQCWPADRPAFVTTKACDAKLPASPSGYAWVMLSFDPTCNGIGCMIDSSGGPHTW